ncbi:MAG: universal stress protein [Hyphomicrobiales bacterium]|nr:universal stress protein [Hyphomicrobiales bacterium]
MPAILVPVDGSAHAAKALHIACDLAGKYGGRIALYHALARDKPAHDLLRLTAAKTFGPKLTKALERAAERAPQPLPDDILRAIGRKILQASAAKARQRGVETDTLEIEAGDPSEGILVAARTAGANTIVMGCRGLSDADACSFGSVSNTVFQNADCTCISVK